MKSFEKNREKAEEQDLGALAMKYLGGLVFATVSAVVLSAVFALIFSATSLSDGFLPYAAGAVLFLSTAAAGWFVADKADRHGLVNGVVTAVAFFLLRMLIGLIFGVFEFSAVTLLYLAVSVVGGAVGGIAAVNRPKARRYR